MLPLVVGVNVPIAMIEIKAAYSSEAPRPCKVIEAVFCGPQQG